MSNRMSLLAGAGLSALMIMSAATSADAKTAKKHAAHAAPYNAEVEMLKAQVAALTARLDAQDSAQRQTASQAQAAQDAAAAASAQTAAVQTQVAAQAKAVPDQVKVALAAQPKPKAQWFNDTTISGRVYFNFSTIDQKVNGAKVGTAGTSNGTGFNIKRVYLGVDHTFSPIFSGNVTMDISNVVGQTNTQNFQTTTVGGTPATLSNTPALVGKGFYVKKAYLQAKLNPAFVVRVGAADLPWVPFVEGLYGYRHIENTLIDRTNFGTSADWGIHVLGDLAGGLISYQVSVIDGAGYRNVKVTKSVDVEGRISANYKGFTAGIGGYTGKRGNDVQNAVNVFNTAERIDAVVAYKAKKFSVGAEYFHAKNWNTVTSVVTDKSDGYSIFASVSPVDKFAVFGRYDRVKPTKEINNAEKENYFNVGIQYSPVKIVDLALVYKRDKVDNGVFGTQNGNIGGSTDGTYDEFGLFGQFRF